MSSQEFFVPSKDVMTSIVIPTIVFCIGMVVAMLVGINKCKQWELDKVVEMRRTRRVLQRVTNRLREKNFKTIQKARTIRKRAASAKPSLTKEFAPPAYVSQTSTDAPCGTSPPPSYEDTLLEEYYRECHPSRNSQVSRRSIPVPDSPKRHARARQNATRRTSRPNNNQMRKGSLHIV